MVSGLQNKPPLLGAGLRPAAILFDLDGTLVDSATDLALAVNRCLQEFGLPTAEEVAVRGWVGNGAAKLVERALCDRLSCEPADLESGLADKALEAFFRHYEACCTETTQLYPGVEQTLAQLQPYYPMACVTNKPERYARRLLDHLQLPFAVLIGGDTLAVKKPAPEPLLQACSELGVDAGDCLMVGDSRSDVLSARAAGMPVLCYSYGYNHGAPVASLNPDFLRHEFIGLMSGD